MNDVLLYRIDVFFLSEVCIILELLGWFIYCTLVI
jgi:hypothetical protein